MAKITYEHKTDGVYCGDCILRKINKGSRTCFAFNDTFLLSDNLEYPNNGKDLKFVKEYRIKRCQACIDEFGE